MTGTVIVCIEDAGLERILEFGKSYEVFGYGVCGCSDCKEWVSVARVGSAARSGPIGFAREVSTQCPVCGVEFLSDSLMFSVTRFVSIDTYKKACLAVWNLITNIPGVGFSEK